MKKLRFDYKLTFIYLLFGIVWIFFSDHILEKMITDKEFLTSFQSIKGTFYVVITALLLFVLIRNHFKKLEITSGKVAETENRYKTLYDNSLFAFQSLNNEGHIVDINKQWLNVLGYQKKEVISKRFEDFVHPDYINTFKEKFEELKASGIIHGVILKLKKNDGDYIYINYEGTLAKNKDGSFRSTFCTFKDVSKEYLANEELKQTRLFNDNLIETANVIIIGLNNDGTINLINPFAEKLTGYKKGEVLGKNWFDLFIPKGKYDEVLNEFNLLLKKGRPGRFENPIVTKNGEERIISWSNNEIYNNKGGVIGTISFGIDVTTNREMQAELNEKQHLLNESQKLAKIGNWTYNFASRKVIWSEEMYHIFGLDPSATIPHVLDQSELVTPATAQKVQWHRKHLVETGESYEFEGVGIHSSGEQVSIHVKVKGVFSENGEVIGNYGTVQDITERKKIENELIIAKEKAEESDRLKSAFLANLSHEIRTPMNGILGFTQLLQNPDLTSEKKEDYIKIVQNSGDYLLSIINDIIEIAHLETNQVSSKLGKTDINSIFYDIYAEMSITIPLGKRISLINDCQLADQNTIITTDQIKLKQVLVNLIANAIKYTHSGEISFGCEAVGDNTLKFHVCDTGMGIKKEHQEIIFDRFRQVSETSDAFQYGSGLGLSIAKSYIELLGGKIWVESELGKGSKFYFTLPINPQKTVQTSNDDIMKIAGKKNDKMTILIVEDDDINFQYLNALLSGPNKSIIHAGNGQEAVDICKKAEIIDLVLMDIRMPVMDGLEALKQIRKIRNDLRIIAHTAYAHGPEGSRLIAEGFDGFLAKPLDKSKLFNLLQSLN